jgi:hypothetical protein
MRRGGQPAAFWRSPRALGGRTPRRRGCSGPGPIPASTLWWRWPVAGAVPCCWPRLAGCVLVLEDGGEEPYRIDRMLTQWRTSGVLEGVAGIGLGRFRWQQDDVLPAESAPAPGAAGAPRRPAGFPGVGLSKEAHEPTARPVLGQPALPNNKKGPQGPLLANTAGAIS